jgi:hypothetical protein
MAGFKSERVAGFNLECMAGFIGIRNVVTNCEVLAYYHGHGAPRQTSARNRRSGLICANGLQRLKTLTVRPWGGVIEEEAQHLPRGVRPARISVGASGAASRPSVSGSVDFPVLKDSRPLASAWIVRV